MPVALIEGDPADAQRVIQDYGEVVLEDGHLFSASVSFKGEIPEPVDPVDPAPGVDVDASDGHEAARVSDSAKTNAAAGARVLPDTGGAWLTLPLAGAGALLALAGLLVWRATR